MRIAIAATGNEPASQVSQHGARAPYYLVYDENGTFQEVHKNPYANSERGAGPKVARFLMQLGVQLLVAGDFGGRFVEELETGGIKQLHMTGIISEIITDVIAQ
ncbi:MAG: NifB/NifX family molybdenum-iron cluster-binding protein [Thioalkalispiraceae bacterium]|jgi:predicted Fe-Mo cluster-binding NifX family protein